jgi:rhamnose utilization protein RhaD (predicted bifunctional aldolase and dehydrogenase)
LVKGFSMAVYKHVNYLWDDQVADQLDPVERLRYRSNILGADQRITNTGGGNTSSKIRMSDPLTGESVDVLWVKGSGGDLRTSKRENFASLYMDKLLDLQRIYDAAPVRGVKTEIEDQMVGMYPHTTFNLNPRASSIDTPLHGFIPYRHVDHMHPISVIAIAASQDQEELTRVVYGEEVGWVPWQRPGFDLGLVMGKMASETPRLKGLVMGQHGLINWADDDKACYELTLNLIERAAEYIAARDKGTDTFGGAKYQSLPDAERENLLVQLLPTLRGMVSQQKRFIGTVHVTESVLEFVNSQDAARLAEIGTSCPDHFLRTKIKPLYVDWNPGGLQGLLRGLQAPRFPRHARSQSDRDPDPWAGVDRLGQEQEREPRYGRVLFAGYRGHARQRSHQRIPGPATPGSLRYRILAA